MASLDFEQEKSIFRDFYNSNFQLLTDAKNSFVTLVNALITHSQIRGVSKIEGRVKDREESIKKFTRKYRVELESKNTPYTIKERVTDLIGLRIVCLYKDDVDGIKKAICEHFELIDVTDKTALIENTVDSFGYKGLHLDLKMGEERRDLPEYEPYASFSFELQIRTIVQDSWSVLDHKIKYKKSITTHLKRRINTLAALFELADREFKEIRECTEREIKKAKEENGDLIIQTNVASQPNGKALPPSLALDAFGFLKIANHFFASFEFEAHKVDGFTQEIVFMEPSITRRVFNFYMMENITKVKLYKIEFEKNNPGDELNPYTIIRHCVYLGDAIAFKTILNNISRESFDKWLLENQAKCAS